MKKILLVLSIFSMLPCYANLEICINDEQCRDFPENRVQAIETTTQPTYGINVVMKNGHKNFIEANSRSGAVLMLHEAYDQLKNYYGWSDDYFYDVVEKQDKAGLRIH